MLRIFLIFFFISTNVLAAPNIVVSIKPIHSIVSNITQGVTVPKLLIKDKQSVHHFHLQPLQMSLLEKADLIIFVHPSIEEGIAKTLDNISMQRKFYAVEHSILKHHEETHQGFLDKLLALIQPLKEQKGIHYHPSHADYHVWLDIEIMQKFATRLTNKLILIDAKNRSTYQKNLSKLNKKLDALKLQIKKQLMVYQKKPIISYSNSFEHFIKANKLNKITTVVNNHEQKPSAKNILDARKVIRSKHVKCLISGIEITPKRINTIVEYFNIKHQKVDIVGFNYPANTTHYFALMRNITEIFEQCLR